MIFIFRTFGRRWDTLSAFDYFFMPIFSMHFLGHDILSMIVVIVYCITNLSSLMVTWDLSVRTWSVISGVLASCWIWINRRLSHELAAQGKSRSLESDIVMVAERWFEVLNSVTNWQALNSSGTRSCRFCRSGGHTAAHTPLPTTCRRRVHASAISRAASAPASRSLRSAPVSRPGASPRRQPPHRLPLPIRHHPHQPLRLLLLVSTRHNIRPSWVPSPWMWSPRPRISSPARWIRSPSPRIPSPDRRQQVGFGDDQTHRAEDLPDTYRFIFPGLGTRLFFSPVLTQSESKF